MNNIKLTIDKIEVTGCENQTILDIAKQNGIEIPTLCHDEKVEAFGACGLCVVEIEGSFRLFRSCSTLAQNGMVVFTDTERIQKNRQTTLELLMGDHVGDCLPPCTLACPANTACQGYAKLIACGEYAKAVALIKEKVPFPASLGRICPRPCEAACRRELVEEPIAICALKQFAGDWNIHQNAEPVAPVAPTGKSVAVIGGGPGGLSAAYFLRQKGHAVSVYEAMPKMGGMLQYGVPEYRLPKEILQKEISEIEKTGVKFFNNIKIGKDMALSKLQKTSDAVLVASGAWKNARLGCPGEDLGGVLGAIDFLKDPSDHNFSDCTVAVVGGGDIAMDACRTAVRLGAAAVYNIYRRTMAEMPANISEITEAKEEGIIFLDLKNPLEIVGENNRATAIRLQIMELGEPDASGRKSPVPVPGKEEILKADVIIVAIGQKLDGLGFEELEKTTHGTIAAHEYSFATNLEGVYAIGDATNKGADIAVSAIGEAGRAAEIIDDYLKGKKLSYKAPYLSKTEKKAEDFSDINKSPRTKTACRSAEERKNDFLEVAPALTEAEAKKEARRCLECGCHAYLECKLIAYANRHEMCPEKYSGEIRRRERKTIQESITHDPDKCILCGLCVRICEQEVGEGLLGFVNRGHKTVVAPAPNINLCGHSCADCKKCVESCPTGALCLELKI